ncbi:MAG TPA: ParB/RepB/Spo0J family partition protein [Stellaceae bacterium]|nr:ParB/RepB/Spo0J family partition protein [Stellaceae bacterium]
MSDEAPRGRAPDKAKAARGLGRGLSALFGDEEEERKPENLRNVAIEQLKPGRFQPRRHFDAESLDALAHSVREQGILQPILVRRHPSEPNTYEILAGERRWRAAQAAQLHEVPVILREMDDRAASEIALIENIQRQDLNAIEEGEGYRRLIEEFGYTQDELGRALGKSRSHIANMMRLLGLPDEVKAMIVDGRLSAGHARALVTAPEALSIARDAVEKGLSVRDIEALLRARRDKGARSKVAKVRTKDPNVAALERELTQRLGLKVAIAADGEGGTLSIQYRTLDQLEIILGLMRMEDLKQR